jgi:signal transduction histidine kinase
MELIPDKIEPISLLYVEDEHDSRTLLSSMIETRFPLIQLLTAENGKEGLDIYSQCATDILVTDISMPNMDGLQMARRIKTMKPDVMIIVLTARTDTQYLLYSIDIGINQYVIKPIDSKLLFSAIQKCIDTIALKRMVKKQHEDIVGLNASLISRTDELEMLNRELEAFNYTVSHDLRTPLTIIHGYCQVLQEICSSSMDATCKEFISEILKGVYQMKDLISTLLNFSKINRSDLKTSNLDLSEMAVEIFETLKLSEENERKVNFQIMQDVTVNGDKALLKVLLENLFGNAWKYTSAKDEAVIEFGRKEINGKPVYFVRDNGIGFENEYSATIFEPFKRLNISKDFEGTGIGLATVKRIIQRHGGEIWAEGKVGQGATFYFTLQS